MAGEEKMVNPGKRRGNEHKSFSKCISYCFTWGAVNGRRNSHTPLFVALVIPTELPRQLNVSHAMLINIALRQVQIY